MAEELSGNTKKVYDAMVAIGARGEEKAKNMEDVVREAKIPKGTVANSINELIKKKLVKRKSGEKTARYYIVR
ncbi:MAG: MarR family transcriptional regulator [Methanophagales archaeon ANME-1-THS]|nr:MAG: MarR family transcriptional regulator [Methanophagales archaeon ANME-1-THS]